MIIPEEVRVDNYIIPDIRRTESVGVLPKEYSVIVQKSVYAAIENWKNGITTVTNIDGYEKDPTELACELLVNDIIISFEYAEDIDGYLKEYLLALLGDDFVIEQIIYAEDYISNEVFECCVTIRFGYTLKEIKINCLVHS